MTKSVSVRFSDVEHKALEAKAEELDKTPQDLIKEALEAYGALAPDEGFNLRLRAHLRDILGFSSSEGLEAFILSTLQSVTPPNPGETYRPRIDSNPKTVKLIADTVKENKPLKEISKATGYPISTLSGYLKRKKD